MRDGLGQSVQIPPSAYIAPLPSLPSLLALLSFAHLDPLSSIIIITLLDGAVQIAQLPLLYSVENLLESLKHNT